MGVFPLADTMIRCSVASWSRDHASAGASGWSNEVWWSSRSTTPRRDAAATHFPTDSLTPSDLNLRCPGTGPEIRHGRAERTSYRSAPAVSELAAGNRLQ